MSIKKNIEVIRKGLEMGLTQTDKYSFLELEVAQLEAIDALKSLEKDVAVLNKEVKKLREGMEKIKLIVNSNYTGG